MNPEINRMQAMIDRHLEQVRRDGFEPILIVFPEQNGKKGFCRSCGEKSGKFQITFLGRAIGRDYAYCVAMVCMACLESKERQEEFLDRIEMRYRQTRGMSN